MKNLSKKKFSILVANTIDHFDTALYGFLSPIFAINFFPNSDPLISLILVYSVFATSLVTRPVGAYIFGTIALSSGPDKTLYYSLIGVGISTMAIALLPTYEHIGIYAPIMLISVRCFSGICSSGEITIAKLFILSDQRDLEANKNSYLYQTSSMVGIILASFASGLILQSPMDQFYWRLCFFIGGMCAFFGYKARKLEKRFINSSNFDKRIFVSLHFLLEHKKNLFFVSIISGFSYMTYSIPFIVMNNLIPSFTIYTLEDLLPFTTILLVLDMFLIPVIGHILQKTSAQKTLLYCAILMFITSLPLFYFAENASLNYLIAVKLWIIIIGVFFSCKINIWCNDLIESHEKYLILGLGGAFGTAALGKMAPAICLMLYYYIPSPLVLGIFMMTIAGATILALWFIDSERFSSNKVKIS